MCCNYVEGKIALNLEYILMLCCKMPNNILMLAVTVDVLLLTAQPWVI